MNMNLLRAKIAERGMKHQEVSAAIGMSNTFFSSKLNEWNDNAFTFRQAEALRDVLHLTPAEMGEIFFG